MSKKDEAILNAIKVARAHEKVAIAEARKRAELRIIEETKSSHDALLDAVRVALLAGQTNRQIGMAYGSSDPHTARRLITEAMANEGTGNPSAHPEWKLSRNDDGTFNITAYALGDAKMSGHGVFRIDDDGENFSLIEGDMWIQIQLYNLGYKETVLEEARG